MELRAAYVRGRIGSGREAARSGVPWNSNDARFVSPPRFDRLRHGVRLGQCERQAAAEENREAKANYADGRESHGVGLSFDNAKYPPQRGATVVSARIRRVDAGNYAVLYNNHCKQSWPGSTT